jgi:hypothetical protein
MLHHVLLVRITIGKLWKSRKGIHIHIDPRSFSAPSATADFGPGANVPIVCTTGASVRRHNPKALRADREPVERECVVRFERVRGSEVACTREMVSFTEWEREFRLLKWSRHGRLQEQ